MDEEGKRRKAIAMLRRGIAIEQICTKLGRTRQWLGKWRRRFAAEGEASLRGRSPPCGRLSNVRIDQRFTVGARAERAWDLLMDMPSVAACLPGAGPVTKVGPDSYTGTFTVRLGPIGVKLDGTLKMAESDREALHARLDVDATDRRLGGAMRSQVTMDLVPLDDGRTEISVQTDASLFGKLGQFGQPVIKRKADDLMADFARNLSRALEADPGAPSPEREP